MCHMVTRNFKNVNKSRIINYPLNILLAAWNWRAVLLHSLLYAHCWEVTLSFLNSYYNIDSELMMSLTTVLILSKSCMPSSYSVLALRLWLGADTLYIISTPSKMLICFQKQNTMLSLVAATLLYLTLLVVVAILPHNVVVNIFITVAK